MQRARASPPRSWRCCRPRRRCPGLRMEWGPHPPGQGDPQWPPAGSGGTGLQGDRRPAVEGTSWGGGALERGRTREGVRWGGGALGRGHPGEGACWTPSLCTLHPSRSRRVQQLLLNLGSPGLAPRPPGYGHAPHDTGPAHRCITTPCKAPPTPTGHALQVQPQSPSCPSPSGLSGAAARGSPRTPPAPDSLFSRRCRLLRPLALGTRSELRTAWLMKCCFRLFTWELARAGRQPERGLWAGRVEGVLSGPPRAGKPGPQHRPGFLPAPEGLA